MHPMYTLATVKAARWKLGGNDFELVARRLGQLPKGFCVDNMGLLFGSIMSIP